ncbi:hypothetical protein M2165_004209 [Variovorax sp. TBS-050B]|uniref:DUF3540 domain-containing protein n=1 Tax=Variovorax sp. TBS-050B TaxID=2940551 RepID=UPI0024737D3E|nr:DUF3540 domain-containing protein [Variovorax sp. TBS-050B]MDH6594320.1 hypothetical protein [Variovorax sp. TBS-050B]
MKQRAAPPQDAGTSDAIAGPHEMHALLHRPLPAAPAAWSGSAIGVVVQALADDVFIVEPQAGGERWRCMRAASCLLQPGVGDTVLVAGPQRDHVYLIAVVTQADPAHAQLVVNGDLTLRTRQGGIAIEAGTRLALRSPELALQAQKAQVEIADMDYRGAEVRVTTLVARFVGRTLETVLDRLSVLARSTFRMTEEVEQVRAGQIDMQARETLRLHAKNTLVTSKAIVKVDAEQIHMG